MSKKVLYPIFNDLKQYTIDSYWIDLFTNCSYGKFPKGVSYSNGQLYVYINKIRYVYKFNKHDKENFDFIMNIFKKSLYLESAADNNDVIQELENRTENVIEEWRDIRKKSLKDFYMRKYIIDIMEQYNLTYEEGQSLLNELYMYFSLRYLTSKDIVFEDGNILYINGLIYKDKHFDLVKDVKSVDDEKESSTQSIDPLYKEFKHYIEQLCKMNTM